MKRIVTVSLMLVMSSGVMAAQGSQGKYSYVGAGLQYGEQKSHSLGAFLGDDYKNKGARDLFGVNATASFSPQALDGYAKIEYEGTTAGNTDISNTFLALGGYQNYQRSSLFYSLGVNNYQVERDHQNGGSAKFDEYGVAADIGFAYAVTPFLALTPRYRISYLDEHVMNDYKLTSQFMLGEMVSLELSGGYNTYRDAEQFNAQTALKFAF